MVYSQLLGVLGPAENGLRAGLNDGRIGGYEACALAGEMGDPGDRMKGACTGADGERARVMIGAGDRDLVSIGAGEADRWARYGDDDRNASLYRSFGCREVREHARSRNGLSSIGGTGEGEYVLSVAGE